MAADRELEAVLSRLDELVDPDSQTVFGHAVRQSVDEVLDGPRTGRWDFDQLEKTEKTYVGTKLEILVRAELDLERGPDRDLEIAGVPVDVKWSMISSWQIPEESLGELCLCIGGLRDMTKFQVGIVRCIEAHLNQGRNRDRKRTLSADGREAMRHLVPPSPIPSNFLAELDPEVRAEAMRGRTIQERIATLFRLSPYIPIPRGAVATVARTTGDPMRRVRADSGDPLEGMKVLSSKYGNALIEALGHSRMPRNHFMSVRQEDLDRIPSAAREKLPAAALKRLGV